MSEADCVFCKIASGAIPAARILETADALAFLDVGPLAPGHTLLISRQHVTNVLDAPPRLAAALASELPRLAAAIVRATGATGLNVLHNIGESAGQAVFHLHIHLIPRQAGDGLGYRWNAGRYADGQMPAVQSRIVEELKRS